jgi:Na+-transporting methylmalonyl-CoA/oxaloacetate decarboxylase gamma subunit
VGASATVRDIAIIIVALESIFVFILLGILVWQIWRLTKLIQTEVKPVLQDAQETINTLKATTAFMSDNVVQPAAKASGQAVKAQTTVRTLVREILPRK